MNGQEIAPNKVAFMDHFSKVDYRHVPFSNDSFL
jgi:hypothetical protein